MPDEIDALVEPMQAARGQPVLNRPSLHARKLELRECDEAELLGGDPGDGEVMRRAAVFISADRVRKVPNSGLGNDPGRISMRDALRWPRSAWRSFVCHLKQLVRGPLDKDRPLAVAAGQSPPI